MSVLGVVTAVFFVTMNKSPLAPLILVLYIAIVLLLAGCDSGGGSSSGSNSGGSSGGGGLVSSMANGFAAGAGAAAGHKAIQHGIDKFKKYKENKASNTFKTRERVINPRSRFTGRRR